MSAVFQPTGHWTEASIESVALVEFGTRVTKRVDAGTRYPVYGGGGATFSMDEYNREDCYIVSRFGMSEECVRRVHGKFFLNDSGLTVRTRDENLLFQRFLDIYLLGNQARIFDLGRGAAQKNLNVEAFRQLAVPLPPLHEQKCIVAKLDQAFAALDRAHANAEANISGADEVYRLAIAAILESEGSRGISICLGDISRIRAGAGFPEAEQGELEGAYPFYKVSDMNRAGNEEYLTAANNYISDAVQKRLGAFVFPAGTIVFPKVGGAIATNKKRVLSMESCVDNNIMGLMPDVDKVSPDFLHELMRATDIYEFSNKANPPSITQATVSAWPVQIPSRDQQDRVVGQIRGLRGGIDSLKAHYDMQLANISALRQSLLQAAFSGQLT